MIDEQPELNVSAPVRPTMGPQLHELTVGYTAMLQQAEGYRRAAAQAASERDTALREVDRLKQELEALKGKIVIPDMSESTKASNGREPARAKV